MEHIINNLVLTNTRRNYTREEKLITIAIYDLLLQQYFAIQKVNNKRFRRYQRIFNRGNNCRILLDFDTYVRTLSLLVHLISDVHNFDLKSDNIIVDNGQYYYTFIVDGEEMCVELDVEIPDSSLELLYL